MKTRIIASPLLKIGLGLIVLSVPRPALADDSDIRVDVVVDMTDAGDKLPTPSPDNPTYYFPKTVGYTEKGDPLNHLKPPPPTVEVQRLIAKALAKRGYLVTNKQHPPSIILVLWWGYIAPIIDRRFSMSSGGSAMNSPSDSLYLPGIGISNGTSHAGGSASGVSRSATAGSVEGPSAVLPLGAVWNFMDDHEAYLMVAGDRFQEDLGRVNPIAEDINVAARQQRYFLMVSALDFKSALKKKAVLLWCARVSTELVGRNLDDVLPALISTGVSHFGEETDGPKFSMVKAVPMGHVEVGAPVLKLPFPATPTAPK